VRATQEVAVKQARIVLVLAVATVVAGVALAAVVAAACGSSPRAAAGATGRATGVAGTITLVNPGGPMIAPGQSPPAAPTVVLELVSPASKHVIARGLVARDGTFKIAAPPGRYLVRVAPASGGSATTIAHAVVVAPDGYTRLALGRVRGL
jgi:hypothetical protein